MYSFVFLHSVVSFDSLDSFASTQAPPDVYEKRPPLPSLGTPGTIRVIHGENEWMVVDNKWTSTLDQSGDRIPNF